MNAQEELQLQEHLQAIGKILVRNTPQEQLKDFEAIRPLAKIFYGIMEGLSISSLNF
ncbi:MAG: hypothetical protein O9329_13810 [Microcystis sp. LE19-12.2C]|jgi:hypothetical protein|nr:hypothetical protein [Microcystis sp. LE19-12.2C]